ncbi:hypothetical protein AVEN_263719-1 [Araneus ventricosus]|uniref:DUF4817 domain-containing protein n=1 Tax=Araneus ventricosus TaxID=182803 RepID=A0A4Y2ATY7_ARAVE|nr:hypothetical protein AVEN_263719-1 [Araneus ventricosus]
MWTPQEKAQCIAWFIETKSDAQVQRKFVTRYVREPQSRPTIQARYTPFIQVVFAINRGQAAHLFRKLTLDLGIGLCLYEPGYTVYSFSCGVHILCQTCVYWKAKKFYELTCHMLKTVYYHLV